MNIQQTTRFHIFRDPQHDNIDKHFTIVKYYPKCLWHQNPVFERESRQILSLKDGVESAINLYYTALNPLLEHGFVIVVVPSHDPMKTVSGIRKLAQRLVVHRRIDATVCLVRHMRTCKLSHGGDRSIERHLDSIRVQHPHLIRGQAVLLLDDVRTTGNSLDACKLLLMQNGALAVKCVAIAQTVRE